MMLKFTVITAVSVIAILSGCFAQAQVLEFRGERIGAALPKAQPVINLGDVVINVVIAKVQNVGAEPELLIAKFGGKEVDAAPFKSVTTIHSEKRTRNVLNAEGKQVEQTYTVQIPVVTQVANRKENFTPTEEERSVPLSTVQAFSLTGNPVDKEILTKRLQNPTHVLLLKEPVNESNKLNPFYAAILREDTLLLFLASPNGPQKIRPPMLITVYHVKDLDVFSKDGEDLDPDLFVQMVKSKVTPKEWEDQAIVKAMAADSTLIVSASQETHRELSVLLKQLRIEKAKAKEDK